MDAEEVSKLTETALVAGVSDEELLLDAKIQIVRCIGQGGLGAVYEGYHQLLQQKVAVKILLAAASVSDLQRFRREAQASFSLAHENIVCVRDFGASSQGREFIVMDYVDGESLANIVKNEGALGESHVIELSLQIARGLEYAHSHNVVHRDIKPSNIMVSRTESIGKFDRVKIVDFGVAQFVHSRLQESNRLTQTGETVGTPFYMSPEQALGDVTDQRTDIYSFGCTLFEMLSGRPPFEGENHLAVMTQHLHKDAPFLDKSVCSKSLNDLIRRCMAKNPAQRYQSFSEVIADLERVIGGHPLQRVKAAAGLQLRTVLAGVGIIALISLVSWLTLSVMSPGANAPHAVIDARNESAKTSAYDSSDYSGISLLNNGRLNEAREQFEKARLSATTGSRRLLHSLQKLRLLAKLQQRDADEKSLTTEINQTARKVESSVKLNHVFIHERQETLELLPEKIPVEKHAKLVSLANDINEVAQHLTETRHYSEAENLLKLLLQKLQANLPNSNATLGTTYQNLAEICCSNQNFIEAQKFSLAAVSSKKELYGRNSLPVADSLVRRASIEVKAGNTSIAQECLNEAAGAMGQNSAISAEKTEKLQIDKAFVEAELAFRTAKPDTALALLPGCYAAYTKEGDLNQADKVVNMQLDISQVLNQFSKAETLLLVLINSADQKNEADLRLAAWEMSLGDLYFRQPIAAGVTHKAAAHFQRAMEIRQHLLSPDDLLVEDAILRVCVSRGNNNIPALAAQVIAINEIDGKETENYVKAIQLLCAANASDASPELRSQFNRSFDIILKHAYTDSLDQRFYDTALVLWPDPEQWSRLEEFLKAQVSAAENNKSPNSIQTAKALAALARFYAFRGDTRRGCEELSRAYRLVTKLSTKNLTTTERWDVADIVLEFAKASKSEGKDNWMDLLHESNSLRYVPPQKSAP